MFRDPQAAKLISGLNLLLIWKKKKEFLKKRLMGNSFPDTAYLGITSVL